MKILYEILDDYESCPFCRSSETLIVGSCQEIAEATSDKSGYAVCCAANMGGCGATGGFAISESKALDKWNMRRKRASK